MAEVCMALVVAGLTAYAVLGSADFGAGVWDLTAGGAERGGRVRGMVQRSMAPVWEVNHVWLIFVLVILWTAFGEAFGSIFSTLFVPLSLAIFGIILRGAAFALRGQAATINEARTLGAIFALASLLVPFFLGSSLGAIASGAVPAGNAAGDSISSWLSPTGVTVGVLAVLTGAYLSAVYMAADSVRADLPDLVSAFRARALIAGIGAGALAIGALLVLREDAEVLYDGLTSGAGLAFVIASGLTGVVTLRLVWTRRFALARWTAPAAVAAITIGWFVAQSPYILPTDLTIDQAAAPDATLTAVLISVAVGACLLIPSLYFLYSLVLRGRLDQSYEPLDQRFKPIATGDPAAQEEAPQ
jgi:cytochrome d ubiquinol oxidase subunit II